jgi:hypothetical protein
VTIPTGIAIALPPSTEGCGGARLGGRMGAVLNTPGTIDADAAAKSASHPRVFSSVTRDAIAQLDCAETRHASACLNLMKRRVAGRFLIDRKRRIVRRGASRARVAVWP